MHYGMAIDLQLCFGCTECAVACKSNNNLPNNMWWNRVLTDGGDYPDTAKGTYPQVCMAHYPVGCQHCANPACAKVCPVGATWRDEKTGIVVQDVDKCIRLPHVHGRLPLQRPARSTGKSRPTPLTSPWRLRCPQARCRRGGEVHLLRQPPCTRRRARLHGALPRTSAVLGRSGRSWQRRVSRDRRTSHRSLAGRQRHGAFRVLLGVKECLND